MCYRTAFLGVFIFILCNAAQINAHYEDFIRTEPNFKPLVEAEEVLYFILQELRASSIWADVVQSELDIEITRYRIFLATKFQLIFIVL